jgi:hypothetical protein
VTIESTIFCAVTPYTAVIVLRHFRRIILPLSSRWKSRSGKQSSIRRQSIWRQNVPLKRRWICNWLYDVTLMEIVVFIYIDPQARKNVIFFGLNQHDEIWDFFSSQIWKYGKNFKESQLNKEASTGHKICTQDPKSYWSSFFTCVLFSYYHLSISIFWNVIPWDQFQLNLDYMFLLVNIMWRIDPVLSGNSVNSSRC